MPPLKDLIFLLIAAFTIGTAGVVTFSRNIVYSGFALLGTFSGAVGLFILLSSDFVAMTQLLIYVGGILVLILFAIMLTNRIGDVNLTNLSLNRKVAIPVMGLFFIFLSSLLAKGTWLVLEPEAHKSMVAPIGDALLNKYLLPFEVISIVLLGALVGAVVLVKREVK